MGLLSWTGVDGTWLLGSSYPGILGRFQGWEPATVDVGEEAVALGTGDTHQFVFRTDCGATLRLEGLDGAARATGTDGAPRAETVLDALDALRRHLRGPRIVNVWPHWSEGDTSTVVACARLAGTEVSWSQESRWPLRYALSLSLRALDGAPLLYPYPAGA